VEHGSGRRRSEQQHIRRADTKARVASGLRIVPGSGPAGLSALTFRPKSTGASHR
jgi:hypothetical protein